VYKKTSIGKPNLHISQNYIKSPKLAREIVSYLNLVDNDLVYEIGPGKGSLTDAMVNHKINYIGIEKDSNLYASIKSKYARIPNFKVLNQDILKYSFTTVENFKVIGNIPFNITSAILNKLYGPENLPSKSVLILQTEAFERIAGLNSTTLFSLKFFPYIKVGHIRNLNRFDFSPAPRVSTTLVSITKRDDFLISFPEKVEWLDFISFLFLNSWHQNYGLNKLFTHKQLSRIKRNLQLNEVSGLSKISHIKFIELFRLLKDISSLDKRSVILGSYQNLNSQQNKLHKRSRTNKKLFL
jgi:23S rRNA (adenine-N6)-dimethyltransferase